MESHLYLSALPVFIVLILAEALYTRLQGKPVYDGKETLSTTAVHIGHQLITILSAAVLAPLSVFVFQHKLMDIPINWMSALAVLILVDFLYYWFHRASHQIHWLWASHAVHHSSKHMNLAAALRLGWTGFLSGLWLLVLPLVFLGFPPLVVGLALKVNLIYQFPIHTQVIGKLPVLDGIFNTPSNHRVHHANNAAYIDKNFGGILILWDRLFGTYQPELADTPCEFGLTHELNTYNPLAVALDEWRRLFQKMRRAPGLPQAMAAAISAPSVP